MVPTPGSFDHEWQKLRQHPDFSFGVVFVRTDWPRHEEPPGLDQDEVEGRLTQSGYDAIDAYSNDGDDECDTT